MRRSLRSALGALIALAPAAASAAEPTRMRDGGVAVGGRQVKCDNVRTRFDRDLPNLGAVAPEARLLLLNPGLLRRYSGTVQLFVFFHECGHTKVGASELDADSWAVRRGVRDGWLDRTGLANICRSFENAPETRTHPSGKRRCANLDRIFATVEAETAREPNRSTASTTSGGTAPTAKPQLVAGPRLVRSSVLR
ncbi:MAG: hypothetical protein SFW09_04720 [Hyphomicrobiaceae bacterium]|nr:hypothetical protein [Hyphomicrobiaceae bacterium]